ncbi:DUF6011 domain-containing protein [Amycolatopsis sp. VS8301801F10]|uniref:DUF6011 domain-containing protein n=1 Tax=Amycolatopsis sp. VS8301801F10 TaxID=2652442 RepID=UPI0038FC8F72
MTKPECEKCHRPLKDAESVRLGYGPVCYQREFGPLPPKPVRTIVRVHGLGWLHDDPHPVDPNQIPLPLENTVPAPQIFRKKPVEIEAMQVLDDLNQVYDVAAWVDRNGGKLTDPLHTFDCAFKIHTLEGDMAVNPGDWVIRGVHGEFYPCKPDIFAETYEPADAVSAKDDGHPAATTVQEGQSK